MVMRKPIPEVSNARHVDRIVHFFKYPYPLGWSSGPLAGYSQSKNRYNDSGTQRSMNLGLRC